MINLVFSMVGPRFSDEQSEQFSLVGEWVVLNERNGRLLVDAIGPAAAINWAFAALDQMGREPRAIGAWDRAGVRDGELNLAEWLSMAPDEFAADAEGEPTPARPTEWRELHRWAGWAPKQ